MSTGTAHFQQQVGFRHQHASGPGDAVDADQGRVPPPDGHLELELIARDDLAPELRPVHSAEEHLQAPPLALEQQDRRHLGQSLDHQDPRHDGGSGKVALKEVLVDGDVLVRHQARARLVLHDRVEQVRRVAMGQAVD